MIYQVICSTPCTGGLTLGQVPGVTQPEKASQQVCPTAGPRLSGQRREDGEAKRAIEVFEAS